MGEIFSLRCVTTECEVPSRLGRSACIQLAELGFDSRVDAESGRNKGSLSPHGGRTCPGMTGPLQVSLNDDPVFFCSLPGEVTKFYAPQYPGVPISMLRTAADAIARNVIRPFDVPAPQDHAPSDIELWGGLMRRIDILDYPDAHQSPLAPESAIDRTQVIRTTTQGQQQ